MYEIKQVPAIELFPMIQEILNNGQLVRLTITGSSMYPFLRQNLDRVDLSSARFNSIALCDIVLVLSDNGQYTLHRVVSKQKDSFYTAGDAFDKKEGPFRADQLLAVVETVWRKDKQIHCTSLVWRLLSFLWLFVLPLRSFIINTYRHLRRFI